MTKRQLSPLEQLRLRPVLQLATLSALMNSRRWGPGELAFQGGTSLHLAHGSVRFSEDLDFLIRGGLSISRLSKEIQNHLRLPADIPSDLRITVTTGNDDRNPHQFFVSLGGPQVLDSVKVKVELWQTPASALRSLQLKVSTVASPTGPTFVPTLTLTEVFADKVYALGARERIKPRDIFDLWWLHGQGVLPPGASDLHTRLEIYPAPSGALTDTATAWLASATQRLKELQASHTAQDVAHDLRRWLPSSWPMDTVGAQAMLKVSIRALQDGMNIIKTMTSNSRQPP